LKNAPLFTLGLLFLVSFIPIGCRRQTASGPSAAEQKAFAATVAGVYVEKPDPSLEHVVPAPKVTLSPDGTYEMASVPADWVLKHPTTPHSTVSQVGTWTVGDDGDGSWEIVLNPRGSEPVRLRPFTQGGIGFLFPEPAPAFVRVSYGARGR